MPVININAEKLRELIKNEKDNLKIIDIREPVEYKTIHIKNSKLIPMSELEERLDEIDWKKKVVFICRSGSRSKLMASLLTHDKEILNLQYGIYECFATGRGENLEIDEEMIERYF